jgi:hypothetical protein
LKHADTSRTLQFIRASRPKLIRRMQAAVAARRRMRSGQRLTSAEARKYMSLQRYI